MWYFHIAALWALAVVQPLFDLLGKNGAFFVVRDNTVSDILVFAFGLALVAPLILVAIPALLRLVSVTAGRLAQTVIVSLLFAVLALQLVIGTVSDHSSVAIPVSLVLGGIAGFFYFTRSGLRRFLSALAPAPAIFLALFLLGSQVREILFPPDASAGATSSVVSKTPVFVFVFDELPTISMMKADRTIDAQRFPAFAELAEDSTWYRNTVGVADGTYVAVPAILSGLKPPDKLPNSRSFPRSIFTMLKGRYDIHGVEPLTKVCPKNVCKSKPRASQSARLTALWNDLSIVLGHLVLPADLTADLAPIGQDWEDFGNQDDDTELEDAAASQDSGVPTAQGAMVRGRTPVPLRGGDKFVERIIEGIQTIRTIRPTSGKPPLYMVHFVFPHVPWRFLPSGHQYPVQGPKMPGLDDQDWRSNSYLVRQGLQRHHLQASYADVILQEGIDRIKRAGMWDKSLVIVVVDHGANFKPRGSRRPILKENFGEVAGVPFFVKLPGQKQARIDDSPRETTDVLPTIARVTGGGKGWKFDGMPVQQPSNRKFLGMRNGRLAKEIRVPVGEFIRQRDRELQRQLRIYPSGRGGLYKFGPNPQLVGRRVARLPRATITSGRAVIEGAAAYSRVRPSSGVVPAWVGGHFSGAGSGMPIAVAVNGVIEGVGQSYDIAGEKRFSVIVPPQSLKAGSNRVEVFAVRGGSIQRIGAAGR